MELSMDISTHCDRAFLRCGNPRSDPVLRLLGSSQYVPPAARSTHPVTPLSPDNNISGVTQTFLLDRQAGRLTLSHNLCTSFSASCLQFIKFSIQPSRVGMEPGSVVGDSRCGSGDRAVSISMLFSIVALWETRGQRGRI
jgi:hypothetical protein